MKVPKLLNQTKLYIRATRAYRYARRQGIPGLRFAAYGRQLGFRLLSRGHKSGFTYLLRPVESTRYFEFSFVFDIILEARPSFCLDLSSPRLFSFYVVEKRHVDSVTMINPDARDMGRTHDLAAYLHMDNILTDCRDVASLADERERYDAIWAISVVEHIPGTDGDSAAMQRLYAALKPGGRLIVTVPVDRRHWDEFRPGDPYGLQEEAGDQDNFFQRFYTAETISSRLLAPIGAEARRMGWFGEKEPGHFQAYIARWQADGLEATVEDPREIADHYQAYPAWVAMPGAGVCGLEILKKSLG